jgi:Rrf2 family iron-sulfur cluster assembly transcriptional regulator
MNGGSVMRLTTKGRYAVTAMLDLALHEGKGPISLADISERQGISLSYLEQLFAKLRRNDLVKSVRGPGGGYQLKHGQEMISETCLTHNLWCDLSDQIHSFLNNISLADLVARRDVRQVADRQDRRQDNQIFLTSNDLLLDKAAV